MTKHLLLVAIIMFVSVATTSAHDFWLASTRAPESGATTIHGHVGEKFPVPDSRTTPDPIDSWRVIGPAGDMSLKRDFFQDGESLATRLTLTMPATYLGIMTIRAREIEMTGKEFTEYLREEGLDGVIAERGRLDHAERPARERYARYAKIVLHAGVGDSQHITRPSDIKAELVPSVNPATVAPGGTLPVQLLVEGRPVPGALIAAVSRDARIEARTDGQGRVTLDIPARGQWLIKTVHMGKPADTGTPPVDWESYWVTLAFEN